MKVLFVCWILLFGVIGCAVFSPEPTPLTPLPFNKRMPNFTLLDYQGRAVSLTSFYLQKAPILIFLRDFKRDGDWLKELKKVLYKFYTEGAVIFVLYPEDSVSYTEIEDAGMELYFLEDHQNQMATLYGVYEKEKEEPYFAVFMGDVSSRCQYQKVLSDSDKMVSAENLVLIYQRIQQLRE